MSTHRSAALRAAFSKGCDETLADPGDWCSRSASSRARKVVAPEASISIRRSRGGARRKGALWSPGRTCSSPEVTARPAARSKCTTRRPTCLYVVDGEATFVFGGKMEGGKVTSPGQWQGADITGGETHRIAKGDVFVIPAGVPHWFKEVPKSVSYFVVKVLKP